MVITIKRTIQNSQRTIGELFINDVPICETLELPRMGNHVNISCTPAGKYVCTEYLSSTYGQTYIMNHVSGQTYILFHKGNWPKDTEGWIILGVYCGGEMQYDI